ncbi:MAG: hypothetical protein ACUVQ4_04185 [bacterium]
MNILRTIYLKTIRYKLYKSFKPLGFKKGEDFLISTPTKIKDFLKLLPFLGGIRKMGNVILLVPQTFAPFIKMFRTRTFQSIYWSKIPLIFTREFDLLKQELENYQCNWLIELNENANIALPSLVNAERRVAFYNQRNFPYYNILIKGGIESLVNFFQIPVVEPQTLFKFNKLELRSIFKHLAGQPPFLFVNASETEQFVKPETVEWQGGIVVVNKSKDDVETMCKKLYLCNAYYGPDDEFCELARIFKKNIIIP